MTTTTHPHPGQAFDVDVWMASVLEIASDLPCSFEKGTAICRYCRDEVSDLIVVGLWEDDIPVVLAASVRAALLAGWDGVSGCWGTDDRMVAEAARIMAEGFGGLAR